MTAISLLFIDFFLLAVVVGFYFWRASKERNMLFSKASQSMELQQKVYQIQVLQEIGERIGYSLDSSKIVEIITSSIGNLLEYETVTFMLYDDPENIVFKCHVHRAVNHKFIEQVKGFMHASTVEMCNREVDMTKLDERMGGALLDDSLDVNVKSFINIPVIIGDRLLGLINVSSSQLGQFGYTQAGVLYTITNQAAVAVTQLQHVLENEREKLSGIILAMADGVFMVDLHNQLMVFNPAVVDLLRLPVGKTITMFDIVDALAGKVDLRTKIEEALAKNIPLSVEEVYIQDKVMDITITPVRDHTGEQRGAAVNLHDVTSEKSLEKLRQEFTAMMVHELRAPLTAVRWSSESMMKSLGDPKADPAKIKDSVVTIENSASSMLELVNDLLDVAKIEAGKFDLNIQPNDLAQVIKLAVKAFMPQAEARHLGLAYTGPDRMEVKCDRVRINQVLTNLISNAIKYSDTGAVEITLSTDSESKKVIVAIKDTGIGVSPENLHSLFSKFKQLKSDDSARKGTGLGLVVSKGIVEAHSGQIWAESPGENLGSTFFFSIPL